MINIKISELETNLYNSNIELFDWLEDELLLHPEKVKKEIKNLMEERNILNIGIGAF